MIPKTRRLRQKDLEFILSYIRSLNRAGEIAQ